MSAITGFRIDAVHTFQVRTLQSLGYHTRVALSNASHARPEFETIYRVDVTVYAPDGPRRFDDVARVAPQQKKLIDCERFVAGCDRDVEIIFHLIPLRHTPIDGTVSITREELYFLFTQQDHYVEYYRDDGFAAGVLYQSGAFNYDKFSKERSSLLQAPKGYVGTEVDTIFSVVNSSLDPAWTTTALLRCTLQAADGKRISWTEELPPFVPVSISMRERAAGLVSLTDEPQFLCFMGLCQNATLLPLTINRDLRTGCIGIEHSLPPIYYATSVTGKLRARAVEGLSRGPLFGGS